MGGASSARARVVAVAGLFVLFIGLSPGIAAAGDKPPDGLHADLDGKPLDLVNVGAYFCQDFDYPRIHCFSSPTALEASVSVTLNAAASSATTVNYVIVYEFTSYQGAYMYMSQNYSLLGLIGWNDRISSFRGLNSQAGVFWTDWLYSGTMFSYCCNTWYGSLGSFDNTFSSVYRN